MSSNNNNNHNLDIHQYTLEELLNLFEIKSTQTLDIYELKRAKKKYQLLHPDKSGLPNEYFIFYQKAYQKIEDYFQYMNPINKTQLQTANQEEEQTKYNPYLNTDKKTQKTMAKVIKTLAPNELNQRMNEMFEQHMAQKPDTKRGDWMKQENPVYDNLPGNISTQEQLSIAMEQIKRNQQNKIVLHRTNNPRQIGAGSAYRGAQLYEEDEIGDQKEDEEDEYISCDPFSRLKYEDVRKVHGAETILVEPDANLLQTRAKNIQEHNQERSKALTPLEKQQALKMFQEQEQARQMRDEKIRRNAYQKTESYAEKNQAILANFMRIGN